MYNNFYFIYQLFCRNMDVIIGGLAYNPKSGIHNFRPTKPYSRDDITWCVKSAAPMPLWLSIFVVYNHISIPFIFIFIFFIATWLLFALLAFEAKPWTVTLTGTNGFRIVLGQSFKCDAQKITTRFFISLSVLGSLVVSIAFTSFYTAFMITPKPANQVGTFHDIIASNFRLTGELEVSVLGESSMVSLS